MVITISSETMEEIAFDDLRENRLNKCWIKNPQRSLFSNGRR